LAKILTVILRQKVDFLVIYATNDNNKFLFRLCLCMRMTRDYSGQLF
jgi:hypothetical protein